MKKLLSASFVLFTVLCLFSFPAPATWAASPDGTAASKTSRALETKSVRVGDIDMSYRTVGEGFPIILIPGYGVTMDMWDPLVIRELSSRYRVILFDNRGMGRTTASEKPFTIKLFMEDTAGLMDALKIRKAHVLGWSMGTFIATELALAYPEKVGKLILYAGNCGWTGPGVVEARPEVFTALFDFSGTKEERSRRIISVMYPKKWIDDHPGFLAGLPRSAGTPPQAVLKGQARAMDAWTGTCARLDTLTRPTLIIAGTEDVVIPPGNSLNMATRIPNSWLVRLPGGHANIYQFPKTFSRCLLTFLEAEAE